MPTVAAGETITLYAQYQDGTAQAVTPVTPLISILDPFGEQVVTDEVPTWTGQTGRYSYALPIPPSGPIGSWTATWSGIINGSAVTASEVFQVVEPGGIVFPDPSCAIVAAGPALWCAPPDPELDPEDAPPFTGWCCDTDLSATGIYEKAVWAAQVASAVLFRLSGFRFPGCVSAQEYLCVRAAPCGCPTIGCGADWRSLPRPSGDALTWLNESCGCGQGCDCRGRSRIDLPYGPVTSVHEVVLNGVTIDPNTWVLVNNRTLYFRDLSQEALVACFDPFSDPLGGLYVSWTHGSAPPADGINAACVLACELLKACVGAPCQLPQRVSNIARQGVSFTLLDPMEFVDKGLTGLYAVDIFLAGYLAGQTTATWVEDVEPTDFSKRAHPRW